MKTYAFTLITLFLIVAALSPIPLAAQNEIPDEIIVSLKSGNAKTLSGFFNENIELDVLENENVYSKAQAQQILTNFFSQNQPVKFNITHPSGEKEGARYVIGNLATKQGIFRVSFLLKKTGGKDFIHQLRIEKQN